MPFRPLPLCLAAGLIAGGLPTARAQPTAALPALVTPATALPAAAPPGRVGRVAAVIGPVSFHLAGATEWQIASPNLPVTNGTALWVAPAGEATIGLGDGNRVVVGPTTEFDLDRLDDQALEATQAQGASYLHLRLVQPGETYIVHTPRGIVTVAAAGRYEIVSGDTEHPTTITVLEGAATLTGIPALVEIGPGRMVTITGDGAATPLTPILGAAVQDEFLRHVLAEERPPAARPAHAPAIIAQMTGAEALDEVGEWSDNAEYGAVWYPPVAAYVPYRQGRWAYVAPWGWTWVDDAPWGFAPTHYGRWSQFDGRWGWVPGRDWAPDRRPIYAPALVGFFGAAALGFGRGPAVGWAPLGPRDVYRPPYAANERAIQVLNQPTGANIRIVNAPVTINRTAITIVPAQVLTNSASVAGAIRPGPLPTSIGPTSMLQFRPQAVPTRATIGATQTVLRQINPTGLTVPAANLGPGPSLAPSLGAAPPQQIGPAALFGGAAAGAIAGGLLRQPPPRNATLPELRARGTTPLERQGPVGNGLPRIARPLPPALPPVAAPAAPRGPGALPAVIYGGAAPNRAAAPRLPPVLPPQGEPGFIPHREDFAQPRREPFANPRPQPQFAPPRQQFAAPRPVAAPFRPAPPPAPRAPPPQQQHREARPER